MLFLFATLQSFLAEPKRSRDETGATAVEYGLLVGLIAIAIITAVTLFGTSLSTLFTNVANQLPGSGAKA